MAGDPVTRAVLFLTSANGATRSFASAAFSPRYFPRTLGGCMLLSGVAGYMWMDDIHKKRFERQEAVYQAAWQAGRRMTRRLTTLQSPERVSIRN
mmetsp:Transcript_20552/g.59628  ORF Transcript_20552/g.59628 Transcript_20552/m.59628 type:complete len:95 (-) Transcript_20552:526-810(-)